jgi:uncharacterized protein (TIGR03435 family)
MSPGGCFQHTGVGVQFSVYLAKLHPKDPERSLGAPVLEKTGLNGGYDFTLEFVSETGAPSAGPPTNDEPAPSASTALRESLGLKLVKTKAALDVLVIDHVDQTPTEN